MTLEGKIAIVAGATRGGGRGIAAELGAAGATVYVTGRTTRQQQSEYKRPETIEETADIVTSLGGKGIAVQVDHLHPAEVAALITRIRREQGRLDILVNDVWGGENLFEWEKSVWEHNLENGLRLLRLGIDTHLITAHYALPLMIEKPGGLLVEVTDGTAEYNATHYRISPFYDLAKVGANRMAWAHAKDLAPHGATSVSITPGWMRSEMMLEHFQATEETWLEGPRSSRTSSFPKARASSAAPWRRWRPIRTGRAGTASRCRAVDWLRFTVSPISTARGPIAGVTCAR